jgi:hypothetical protein
VHAANVHDNTMANATLPVSITSLMTLAWEKPKNTVTGVPYGANEYGSRDRYVYKRVPRDPSPKNPQPEFDFFRAAYKDTLSYKSWREIPDSLWEPVDKFGMPTPVRVAQ